MTQNHEAIKEAFRSNIKHGSLYDYKTRVVWYETEDGDIRFNTKLCYGPALGMGFNWKGIRRIIREFIDDARISGDYDFGDDVAQIFEIEEPDDLDFPDRLTIKVADRYFVQKKLKG